MCNIFYQFTGFTCVLVLLWPCDSDVLCGMLYPRDSESRESKTLDGLWNFLADTSVTRNEGFKKKWWTKSLQAISKATISMPVPSSFNDITQDKTLRDFIGWAWYDRKFYVSRDWSNKRVVMRVDSAHYMAIVWINGEQLMNHSGGHLPFEADLSQLLHFGAKNQVTIAINNTLSPTTLPPGSIQYKNDGNRYPPGYFVQNLQMDFFNYAGIHRSVTLYTTPPILYIDDITLKYTIDQSQSPNSQGQAIIEYNVLVKGGRTQGKASMTRGEASMTRGEAMTQGQVSIEWAVLDAQDKVVVSGVGSEGSITLKNVKLWWPYTAGKNYTAYLYTFQMTAKSGSSFDIYRQPFGVRTVRIENSQLLINNEPFYCHGVAKHEDSDIRGKGLDLPLILRDFNLLVWLGANCIRTSHYPYAEEIMDQCDRLGIVVIDESPGVGIQLVQNMGNVSLQHHKEVMTEMVRRDKNRPSVIMWSVANEPKTNLPEAQFYFKSVIDHTRGLDHTRPVTFVIGPTEFNTDRCARYVDVVCVNRYYGWYSDIGHTELIQKQLKYDLTKWFETFNKPIIITEYGADTVSGLHQSPSVSFTEDYQGDFMSEYHAVFDQLRHQFLVGEMVWNFADFMTAQGVTRVDGNKKGIFTRQRQPKMAAHLLRARYLNLINQTQIEQAQTNRKLNFQTHIDKEGLYL